MTLRGTWDDLNRRLVGALLGLDLGDVLTVGDRVEPVRRRLFSRTAPPSPRRWVSVTAAPTKLIGECVGSTSFGGEWETCAEVEERRERMGWQRPWSPQWPTWQREHPLPGAPRLAPAMVRALQALGCEVADLEVALTHEGPEGCTNARKHPTALAL